MSLHNNNSHQSPNRPEISTREASTSWENIIDLLDYLNSVVDAGILVEFSIKKIAPDLPSRHMENVMAARSLGISRNTIENWRGGATKCSMPLRLTVAVAKEFQGPNEFLAAFSKFTGEDHAGQFSWCAGAS